MSGWKLPLQHSVEVIATFAYALVEDCDIQPTRFNDISPRGMWVEL